MAETPALRGSFDQGQKLPPEAIALRRHSHAKPQPEHAPGPREVLTRFRPGTPSLAMPGASLTR
jgi:hypothetical protein